MTKEEFSLCHHELKLEVELYRRTGKSFQDFFEQIMQKADASFLMVKPMGREGDWKADGYSLRSATVYQCYAPEKMTGAEAARKVEEDFEGARSCWQDKMQRWVFVWSSHGPLPPQVVLALAELRSRYPSLRIDPMGREGLWAVVKGLSLGDREALLGTVPDPSDAPITTAAEIRILMDHLGRRRLVLSDPAQLDLTAIVEKLRRNKLSDAVKGMMMPALPVAKLVEAFVTSMPEPAFSEAISLDLAGKYTELAATTDNPDVVFGSLIDYVLGERRREPKYFWAAAGVVTHYFELCDIFER